MRPTLLAAMTAAILTTSSWAASAQVVQRVAPDSELCRSQLELLISGGKLTADEADAFEAQCDCLAMKQQDPKSETEHSCTRDW